MSEDDPLTARMKEKFREEYKKVFDEGILRFQLMYIFFTFTCYYFKNLN